jgi:hypothetical protein
MEAAFAFSFGRLLAASVTVLVTTLEDAVWLVPLTLSNRYAILHAFAFVLTFTCLSLCVGLITLGLERATVETLKHQDVVLAAAGAVLCWIVTTVLFFKEWCKKRHRRQEVLQDSSGENLFLPVEEDDMEYGSTSGHEARDGPNGVNNRLQPEAKQGPQVWLVMALTVIGAIDEVSYFPGLIAGKVFSVLELTIATTIASLEILAIVIFFLAPCKPVIDFLELVPLYVIVGLFAIILTVQALWGYFLG